MILKKANNDTEVGDEMNPEIICPKCQQKSNIEHVLTAQSNQNVIYECPQCHYEKRNIETSKG